MARRIALVVALCALAAGPTAPFAYAHSGSPDYESLVRDVTPSIPGFDVEVLNGDDRLEVQNTGSSTVTIDGYNKEPYLRMRPDGTVEVNLRSPAYYLNADRFYGADVPDSADPKLVPSWKVVARGGRYEFHDHRMHYMANNVPQQVADRAKRTKVFDWNVPLRAGGTTGTIRGELFWRGAQAGAPVGAFIGLGVLVLLGGATVVAVRRRRRGAGDPEGAASGEEAW
jgi:hypothetical protein